jgi:MoaA/NifB/PqqE/SkfB family radical SAM enzyme
MIPEGPVVIWGAGIRGRGIAMMLKRHGRKVEWFYDRELKGPWRGVPVYAAKPAVTDPAVVIAMTMTKAREPIEYCRTYHIPHSIPHSFCPYYPTINVCNICNLHCRACPRPKGIDWMPASLFEKVLDKMVREIPYLYMTDLYAWGDPLLNKDIPEIARICNERGVASGISTSLSVIRTLRALLKEQPTLIKVATSGVGENYEWGHDGVTWPIFERNCRILSEIKGETLVELYWHVTKRNISDAPALREMCEKYGFRFKPILSTVFADYVANWLERGKMPIRTQELAKEMLVPMAELITDSQLNQSKKCLLETAYPNLNPDGTVMQCVGWAGTRNLGSYLDVPLADIPRLREEGEVCQRCKKLGLGRYFNLDKYEETISKRLYDI